LTPRKRHLQKKYKLYFLTTVALKPSARPGHEAKKTTTTSLYVIYILFFNKITWYKLVGYEF